MKVRQLIVAGLMALGLAGAGLAAPAGSPGAPVEAQAIEGGSLMVCNHAQSFTDIKAKKVNSLGTYAEQWLHAWVPDPNSSIGECTDYDYPSVWRVDTDPLGPSHSYKTRYDTLIAGSWSLGSWNSCHTNSDNHSSDPTNNASGKKRVVYRNYDHGDCTN